MVRPDGLPGIYGVVETRLAVGIVALNERQEVLLVGQYRYALGEYSWEIVEGGGEPGESGLHTAQRELREETGVLAEQWEELGAEVQLSNCISSERAVFFLARGLEQIAAEPEGTEVLEPRWVPVGQAMTMIDRGEIKDAMTIIALHRLVRREGQKKAAGSPA